MADIEKLISEYAVSRRIDKDKLFRTGEYYVAEIARKLGLQTTFDKIELCGQIIRKLILDYNYFGEYNSTQINSFLKLYESANNGSIPDKIKLHDLEQTLHNGSNPKIIQIMTVLNRGSKYYYMTQDDTNKFSRKTYNAELQRRVQADEQRLQEIEEEQQQITEQIDDPILRREQRIAERKKRQQELDEQEEIRRNQQLEEDMQIMMQDKQEIEEYKKNHRLQFNEATQNDFLTNKEMAEPFPRVTFANNRGLNELRRQSTARINNIGQVNLQEFQQAQRNRQRNVNLQPRAKKNKLGISGMDDLIRVVVNLKNDVKQIREAQSVESAQNWIARKGYGDLYDVGEEDLDGDGYNEVVVKDKSGKKVIVNGYTTEPSLFPYRNLYYSQNPTKELRKNKPWKDYVKRELYKPTYDETGRAITSIHEDAAQFDERLGNIGYTKRLTPRNRSSYQAFTAKCVAPFYYALRYLNYHNVPFKLAQLSGYLWKEIVRDPALIHVYSENVFTEVQDAKELAKLCKAPEVKEAIEEIVVPYLTQPSTLFENILPVIIDKWRESGFTMTANDVRDFILVSNAAINDEDVPNRDQYPEWKAQKLATTQGLEQYVEEIAHFHEE